MLIQALPVMALNPRAGGGCSATAGNQSYNVTYTIQGPNLTTIINGQVQPIDISGTVIAGDARSLSLPGAPPYTISLGQNSATGATAVFTVPSVIVTYGHVGGNSGDQLGPFVIVRQLAPP